MTALRSCLVVALFFAAFAIATPGFGSCHVFAANKVPDQPARAVQVCRAEAIAISYDVDMTDPAWSAVYSTPDQVRKKLPGRYPFYEDPDLIAMRVNQAAVNSKVWSDTWNKGHLTPNNIMSYAVLPKNGTFTMANVAPQYSTFNQESWEKLEEHVIEWIDHHGVALYVVTGIAYNSRSSAKKVDGIAVPDYYWKVLCDITSHESVGFYGHNTPNSADAKQLRTVAEIEKLYGGSILPKSECNTGALNAKHWWSV